MGMIYAKDPPTTAGNLVPKSAWRSVLMPATKSRVCITRILSPWLREQETDQNNLTKRRDNFGSGDAFLTYHITSPTKKIF